jgi:hypothetical protein
VSFAAAGAWFISICAAIFVAFERVETFSSKADLELYYLLITVNRTEYGSPWHLAVARFFDKIFGKRQYLHFVDAPSLYRVAIFTLAVHAGLFIWIVASDGLFHVKGVVTVVALSFVICVILHYAVFAKTRILTRLSSGMLNPIFSVVYFLVDISLLILLIALAKLVFSLMLDFLVSDIPGVTAWVLHVEIALRNGQPAWDETFYQVGLTGTPNIVFIMLANAISSFGSLIVITVFVIALLASKATRGGFPCYRDSLIIIRPFGKSPSRYWVSSLSAHLR